MAKGIGCESGLSRPFRSGSVFSPPGSLSRLMTRLRFASLALLVPAVVAASGTKQTAVFAGGCFWGVEAVFEHLRGVQSATSGYATPVDDPKGFAEAVRVVYDPSRISYDQLLQIFFLVAHDPTEVDRQGPDVGPRYRSIVFVRSEEERTAVRHAIDSLHSAYHAPIATEIAALRSFRIAEDFHQDYVVHHPQEAYVVVNDLPKIAELRQRYPALYQQ
jgi:peptide-methionine (S)-S-oxide reductase